MHDPFTDRTPGGAVPDPTPIGLDDTEALAELYDDVLDRDFIEDDSLEAQMRARVRASEEDARAQAPNRMAAAAKAVTLLQRDIDHQPDPVAPTLAPRLLPAAEASPAQAVTTPPPPAPPVMASTAAPSGPVASAEPARPRPSDATTSLKVVPTAGPAAVLSAVYAASAKDPARSTTPLYELRPPVGPDGEARGDNLVIYAERLEHRDRHGRLRQRLPMRDIVEVTVQRRITGNSVVFRNRSGTDLVMKGLRPEVAEEIRLVVMTQVEVELEGTRQRSVGVAAPPPPATAEALTPAAPSMSSALFDEADLLRHLVDLHRAGVIDERELVAKTEVVAQLARAARGADHPVTSA